jgi:hypothetical protein
MPQSVFIRVLTSPIDSKGDDLFKAVANFNDNFEDEKIFIVNMNGFSNIVTSPFAYWISESTRNKLREFPRFEPAAATVRQGLATGDDPQFVRAIWEVSPEDLYFCYYPSNGLNYCDFKDPIIEAFIARRKKGKMKWAFQFSLLTRL